MLAKLINRSIARYKTLRQESKVQPQDAALNRVYLTLFQLQRNHSFIEIKLEGDDVTYQSMILSLDPTQRNILIDELFPSGFIGLVGQKLQIIVRQNVGRKLTFASVILERHSEQGVPLYVIKMPDSLDVDQRRSAYRLPISTKAAIASNFTAPDYQQCRGKLRNVSSTGICIEVEGGDLEKLDYDDHLTRVAFDFAGTNIDCDLAVRSMEAANSGDHSEEKSRWVIGAEFVDLPQETQRVLERSIMRIQRNRIKFSSDMEVRQAIA